MSKVVQWKRGNTSATTSYTGYEGEITVNTDSWNLHVHDGVTAGGWVIDSSNNGGSFGEVTVSGNLTANNILANVDVIASGNVTAVYFLGNGSQLTGVSDDVNTAITTTNTSMKSYVDGQISSIGAHYTDANAVSLLSDFGSNAISTTGNVSAGHITTTGNIIPSANVTYTLGNVTNQWASLYVSGNTIYLDSVPISISGNTLSVNGSTVATDTDTSTANAEMKSYVDNEISTTQNQILSTNVDVVTYIDSEISTVNSSIAAANVDMKSYVDSEISAIGAHYNDANVVSLLSDFGSNTVVTTGNVTAGNFIGTFVGLSNVATSGSYNDLSNKPTIPTVPTTVSSFTNDANYVASDTTGITGADQVTNMVTLTQAEYDAITPNASTVYFIVG